MRLEKLTRPDTPLFDKGMELYGISFPPHEQRAPHSQRAIMSHPDYSFNAIFDGDQFIGLILCWETDTFIYVEHFCILPQQRNKNYGQRTLRQLTGKGKTVILEIDPPVDDISSRRKRFYERAGFTANPYPHIHPPYHAANSGHSLIVMSAPAPLTPAEYDRFNTYLSTTVMS